MAFPTLSSQQETNRRILEDLQLKKQLIQKGVPPMSIGLGTTAQTIGSMPVVQTIGQPFEFSTATNVPVVQRSVFNPTTANTTGFFVPQDSFYGNSFLPVLPRLEPLPPNQLPK